ncbi:MAG: glycosyltransferase 87 family protein, partial [Nakamurella sp.]
PLDVAAYFTIGAIFLGLMYLWAVASTARIARRRIWDTAIMCLSPLLVVHAFTNWDLLAIGITAGAMLAWARKKPVLAGALLGLGAAAKLYPILLLGPLLILCLRTGKMCAWRRAAVAAAAVWLVINVPVWLAYPQGWYEFIRLNSERPPEYDSWYYIYATLTRSSIWNAAPGTDTPSLVNGLSLGLFLVACAAIGWLGLAARRRPRFAQLAFLVIAAFLLTNKVWSPQYSLWLLPLAVLALPRWRPLLLWQASEVVVWVLLMFSFAGVANKGLSIYPFINAALLRDVMVLILVFLVVKDILRPAGDLVRMAGDDDPSGGVLEDAEDKFTISSLPALWRRMRQGRREQQPEPESVDAQH